MFIFKYIFYAVAISILVLSVYSLSVVLTVLSYFAAPFVIICVVFFFVYIYMNEKKEEEDEHSTQHKP